MQFDIFEQSIESTEPPQKLSVYLQAMWYDKKHDWDTAHQLVDQLEDTTACWVHAYLHRKEGDTGNAGYWYRRAGKPMPVITLDKEWEIIVKALL